MATKSEVTAYVKGKLARDDGWALKALMLVYSRQTHDEQSSEVTVHRNSMGFSAYDAEILSSFAKQYEKRNFLSPKQLAILHKRMPHYHRQVIEASDPEKLTALVEKTRTLSEPTATPPMRSMELSA